MDRKRQRKPTAKVPVEHFRSIAAFLPVFQRDGFRAGDNVEMREVEPGVFSMPYAKLSDDALGFIQAAYTAGLVMMDFDWGKWVQTPTAKKMLRDQASLAKAAPEQLARLITARIRLDRFADTLLDDFETGLILRIVKRAAALLDEEPRSGG